MVVISLRVQVARSRNRLWKLCTGRPSASSLLARLRRAAGEGWAGATIEARSRAAAVGSSSSNSMGLRRSRMCHSTWQVSMHRKTWARTGGDPGVVAGEGEAVCGNGDVEQLGELVAVLDAADGAGDLVLALGAGAAGELLGKLTECRFGGLQQILALAGPLLGQKRVLADDEALAGKLGSSDLGEIAFVEHPELQGAHLEHRTSPPP